MWKKEDEQPQRPATTSAPRPDVHVQRSVPARSGHATIGPSIVIHGEVTGDEDLIIQGQIDGSVTLDLHSVTVGEGGRVKAGIKGRVITVEGDVEGDLTAQEQIVLRGTARVQGDLKAPRVVLEDGATFRGLVDMGVAADKGQTARAGSSANKEEAKSDASSQSSSVSEAKRPETGSSGAKRPAPGQEKSASTPAN